VLAAQRSFAFGELRGERATYIEHLDCSVTH